VPAAMTMIDSATLITKCFGGHMPSTPGGK
jgi:hypothetical protein